jgi:hypothetical protein
VHPILASRQRLGLLLLAWGLVGLMLAMLVRALVALPWTEAALFSVPLAMLAAPVSLSAWYVCRAMPLARVTALRAGLAAVGAAAITSGFWAGAGRLWWQALERGGFLLPPGRMGAVVALIGGLGALSYLLAVAVHYLLQAFEESAVAARRELQLQVAQRDAELRALRAQVDPHFLFNSLNSIAGLIGSDPAKARLMCQLLGDFLRDSLTVGSALRIPLAREVQLAEQYLRVEQVRFGVRLAVRAVIAPEAAAVPVPPLLLQPLVENAVRHGIATRLDGGAIDIEVARAGARAVIVVENPRDDEGGRSGTGLGLGIVRRRLAAAFGDRGALAIEAAPERYRVSVTVPVEEALA